MDMDIDYGDRKDRRKRKVSNYQVQTRLPSMCMLLFVLLPGLCGLLHVAQWSIDKHPLSTCLHSVAQAAAVAPSLPMPCHDRFHPCQLYLNPCSTP
jgi:hypothetical protein